MKKLTNCKTCQHPVASNAKVCPNCGAKLSRWGFWKILMVIFASLFVFNFLNYLFGAGSSSSTSTQPKPKTAHEVVAENLVFDFSWRKGGFGSVMLLDATITNNSPHDIKDLVIKCEHSSNSGTRIDSNRKTAYESVMAGKKVKLRDFNMGFAHSQAASSSCEISDFVITSNNK